jgi:hypothetical protein
MNARKMRMPVRFGRASALGLAPENVVVISPYVGGGLRPEELAARC